MNLDFDTGITEFRAAVAAWLRRARGSQEWHRARVLAALTDHGSSACA